MSQSATMQSVAKVVFPSLLFVIMWVLMTMEKVTLVWTLRILRHADVSFEAGYFTVGLLILFPYVFSMFEMLWNISFLTVAKETQLPPLKNLVLGITACIVESACVVVFTTVVATVLPVFIILPAMSGVFSISIIMNDIKKTDDEGGESKGSRCFRRRAIGGIYTVIAPSMAAGVLWFYGVLGWLQAISMGVSTLGLAIVWTSSVQTQIQTTSLGFTPHPKRVQLFYGFLRTIFVIVFLALEVFLRTSDSSVQEMLTQFRDNFSGVLSYKLMLPLGLNMMAGLFAHGFTYLSVAFCQPLAGMVLPSLLSTVTAILLSVGVLAPYVYLAEEVQDFGGTTPLLIASGILAISWAVPYIIRTSEFVRKPSSLYIPFETMFLSYGWSSVFFDQHLLLSYRHDGFDRAFTLGKNAGKTSRIYVCTTMYREADYETERLLYSLRGLSLSEKFTQCLLEAHIFMDNGVRGRELQEFGQQLIGLLVQKLGMDIEHAKTIETPYGVQLRWTFPGGMPVFVHFKDPGKVKPKKRWSQCMYINYVMKYRKIIGEKNCQNMKLTKSPTSETLASNDSTYDADPVKSNSFVLKEFNKTMESLYPGLDRYTKTDHMDSDDQGFASVDESSPPISHSSSQARLDTESTDSNSVDLDQKDEPRKGVFNLGFTDDNGKSFPIKGGQPGVTSGAGFIPEGRKLDGERDPWSKEGGQIRVNLDTEYDDDHTYILATDADMEFKDDAVLELLHLCNSDNRLGGACGRTHPVGKHVSSIVWHQKFEYAKDFWMIKNAQNVIGSVMCAPGCFSLYRASAINDVMKKYATPTQTPFTVYVKDTGEDRWMATLMMINGWRLRFSAFADNTTYCPDTFEEFFKQRRRWILSDIANALLVVQNLVRLVRNNDCFTFVYVSYLVNMFVNNVITPGTAIVMITAGLELVFDVPYIYTTVPMAVIVYAYAIFCTKASTRWQTIATSVLTFFMGIVFFAVAVWGSYKIVATMVNEIFIGHFRFQQHYVILMLTLSLVYAALAHPRESYQIVYGFAYLFIFPAMHVLLPIYSIANIIDQSWGTRDSTKAKIPKLTCLAPLKKFRRKKKNKGGRNEDDNELLKETVASQITNMTDGNEEDRNENAFWENLRGSLLGNDVNLGLEKEELAERLRIMRNRSLTAVLVINALWLALLSFFYMGVSSPLSRLNVYGVISGALYGFTLTIQVIGLTVCRVNYLLRKLARCLYGDVRPMWVCEKK
ncbi:uncharacterized protein LOC124115884 [Haliotis rufescens]|uniref:uncharacterized protein LOC124115884 n=1 Tax=Haliotis rufescens TaxID=6454 RepID=UPI001EB00387|nr:uncharacterized protein LOC124115884 [Haliotis rufescens]